MKRRAGTFVVVVGMLASGCSTTGGHRVEDPPNNRLGGLTEVDLQRKSCFDQGQKMLAVWETRDYDRMVELTHPFAVAAMGGPEKTRETIVKTVQELDEQGIVATVHGLAGPEEIGESGGKLYAILTYGLRMSLEGRQPGVMRSFLIGESSDGGESWVFLDGNGVKNDPELLHQALPDFPDSLQLPPVTPLMAEDGPQAP